MDWARRLTAEKSLFQVYLKARKVASSPWNSRVAWLTFVLVALGLGLNSYFATALVPLSAIVSGVREISEIGFSFTTSILGFLIAGFAIFASLTKPEVFVLLAKLDHPKGGISRLQFMFFNFLLVFVHFIVFLAVCIFIKLLLYKDGPLTGGVQFLFALKPSVEEYVSGLAFALLLSWLLFLLMLLKSFVWNLYQAVLVTIGVEAKLMEDEKTRKRSASR